MTISEENVKIKRNTLVFLYGIARKKFDGQSGKKEVFCNTYDILVESLDCMEKVDNNLIWVAYNAQFDKELLILENIYKEIKK